MRVVRAEVLGFCHGVRRAVERVEAAAARYGTVHSLGPVVHNEHVTARLADVGVRIVRSLDEVPDGGAVAITAHGAEAEIVDRIAERGLSLIDATCPIVRRAQEAAAEGAGAGRTVIVYGDPAHPEVRGILSRTGGRGVAFESADFKDASIEPPLAILAQTTADPAGFERFVDAVRGRLDRRSSWSTRPVRRRSVDTARRPTSPCGSTGWSSLEAEPRRTRSGWPTSAERPASPPSTSLRPPKSRGTSLSGSRRSD